MPDEDKKELNFDVEVKLDAIHQKQIALEVLLMQVLSKLTNLPDNDIMKGRFAVDKSSPFWDEEKQVYSRQHYLEQFEDKTPKKGA